MVVVVRAQATKFKFSMWIEETQAEERWFFSFGFLYGTVLLGALILQCTLQSGCCISELPPKP
jgi:hypothetical protein